MDLTVRVSGLLRMGILTLVVSFVFGDALQSVDALGQNADRTSAQEILNATGIRGGLIVHLGCGDGKLTAALRAGDGYLVHGLDADPQDVQQVRRYVQSCGQYGSVSVDLFDGKRLPYIDNLVNLVVVSDPGGVGMDEVMRVLCPGGVAYVRQAGRWTKAVRRWPDDIDQWTHFLYDATGNAVAKDDRVGSPRRIQWMAGPKRARDHDALSSTSAMTSSGGRMFYIFDEGPTSLIHRPADWKLVARDAFNGVLLWKRDIPTWVTHLFFFRTGPAQMTRRLVSVDDRLYVTLGLDAPVSMLDAATGDTLLTYEGSEKTEELIYHDDVLLTVVGDPNIMNDEAPKVYGYWELSVDRKPNVDKSVVAYRANTGEVLWKKTGENLAHIAPLSLIAHRDKVFFLDNENLCCVDLKTGHNLWKAPFPTEGLFLRNYAPTVVAYDDVVMCLTWNRLCSFSAESGKKLWEQKGAIGFASPGDLFGIDGLAWTIPMTSSIWKDNKLGSDGRIASGINIPREDFIGGGGSEIWGVDIHTGEVKKSLPINVVLPGGHHHRCYRNKATENFLICGRRGLEYVDLVGEDHVNNWWLRGACQYGVMPANGYIYVPPDPCQCFNSIKVNGFYALSAENSLDDMEISRGQSLEKGPAYSRASVPEGDSPIFAARKSGQSPSYSSVALASASAAEGLAWQPPIYNSGSEDWPTYRGNITRSGSTTSHVPTKLSTVWKADIGGELSASVVAAGKLLVSSKESHSIHCLDAETGQPLWQFIAGGRVDSPPTIYDGFCIFGSGDGSVYCLTASGGELAWRFRAAPVDRRVIADNRLESVWPIHGSVLVQDGVVYFAAGRSSYLDGGIRLYGLDVYSGEKLHEALVSASPVYPGKEKPEEKMTGALADILVSDGRRINMRHVQFEKDLVQLDNAELKTLFSTTGLLEDSWMHRQNWCLGYPGRINSHAHTGGVRAKGQADKFPSGKLIVFDDKFAYGVQNPYTWLKHSGNLHPVTHDGHLHQKYSRYQPEWFPIGVRIYAKENKAAGQAAEKQRRREPAPPQTGVGTWAVNEPLQPRAMVLADDVLFMAGWHDAVAVRQRTGSPIDSTEPDPRATVLRAVSTTDGTTIAEYKLACEPVFDGMSAAHGRLYISMKNGTVQCMGTE